MKRARRSTGASAGRLREGIALASVFVLTQCGARSELGSGTSGFDASAHPRPTSDACVPRALTLEVPSDAPWTSTGLVVAAGERLVVRAKGTVRYGGDAPQIGDVNGSSYGLKFYPAAVLPNARIASLIGKVSGTTAVDTGSPVPEGAPGEGTGFVGASYDEIMTQSGMLFLGYNDQRDWFYDNVGSFSVTITIGC